jgi:type I restriction enzyme S subunit
MHIKAGVFLERLASRVSEAEYQERIARIRPEPGDLVFTREAPVGEAFVIPAGMRICLGQRVMLLRPRAEMARGQFLLAQIYSGAVADRIEALTAGTTNPHLNVSEVRQFVLPLPPVQEQTLIEQQLGGLDQRLAAEGRERDKLLTVKAGLMDDLLTGRVRVTPLLG